MAVNSFGGAWRGAEQRVYNWLLDNIEGVDGLTAFSDEMPRSLDINADAKQHWWFEISGPGDATQTQQGRVWCAWQMAARVEGVFMERQDGQTLAGLLYDALPLDAGTGELKGILRLTSQAMPSLVRDTIETRQDRATGGETRVWRLEYPLEIYFTVDAVEEV